MGDFLKLIFGLGCLALLIALGFQYDAAQKLEKANEALRAEIRSLEKNNQETRSQAQKEEKAQSKARREVEKRLEKEVEQTERLQNEVEKLTVKLAAAEKANWLTLLDETEEENVDVNLVPDPEAEPPEQLKQIISRAREAPYYEAAKTILRRCVPLIDKLDPAAKESAKEHLQKALEELLAGEIERLLSAVSQVRGEILQNHPPASRPPYWFPSGIYRAENAQERTAYERAMTYYNLFGMHNANVSKMLRLATIVKRRLKELDMLQGVPGDYEKRLKELQKYPTPLASQTWTEGERIARLAVPRRPKLIVKPPVISVRPRILR